MLADLRHGTAEYYEWAAQEDLDKIEQTETSVRNLMRFIQATLASVHRMRRECSGHLDGVREFLDAAVRGAERSLQEIAEERSLCEQNLRERQQELHYAAQDRVGARIKQKDLCATSPGGSVPLTDRRWTLRQSSQEALAEDPGDLNDLDGLELDFEDFKFEDLELEDPEERVALDREVLRSRPWTGPRASSRPKC